MMNIIKGEKNPDFPLFATAFALFTFVNTFAALFDTLFKAELAPFTTAFVAELAPFITAFAAFVNISPRVVVEFDELELFKGKRLFITGVFFAAL